MTLSREDELRGCFDVSRGAEDGAAEDRAGGDSRLAADSVQVMMIMIILGNTTLVKSNYKWIVWF